MEQDPFRSFAKEDEELTVGSRVTVCWSRSGYSFTALGQIIRLTSKSVDVALLEPVGTPSFYQAGRTIALPRFSDHTLWSTANCVRPLPNQRL